MPPRSSPSRLPWPSRWQCRDRGIFAVVSCAIGRGLREALALICGMVIGDLIYFTLAVLGLAALAHTMGEFFIVVKLAGAGYLIWLGVKLWRQPPAAMAADGDVAPQRGFQRSLLGGLMVTIGNPKAIGFYAGLLRRLSTSTNFPYPKP